MAPRNPEHQCKAKSKRTGKRCGATRVPGTLVCKWHGGMAPQVQAQAQRRLALAEAHLAAEKLGLLIDISPEQALLDEVQRSAGMVAFYQARVEEIASKDAHDLVWGKSKTKVGGDDRGETSEAAPNIWLTLFNAERDRLTRTCAAALRAGIEERRVQLAENQGLLIASALRRILNEMLSTVLAVVPSEVADKVNGVWESTVVEIVPRELRAISA